MACSAYLVALGATLAAAALAASSSLGAVSGDMAGLSTSVAGLGVLGALRAVSAWNHVSPGALGWEVREHGTYSCGPRLKIGKIHRSAQSSRLSPDRWKDLPPQL